MNCNCDNDSLTSEDWQQIAAQGALQKHVRSADPDALKALIRTDEVTWQRLGLDFRQVREVHRALQLLCNNDDDVQTMNAEWINAMERSCSEYRTKKRDGWCPRGKLAFTFRWAPGRDLISVIRYSWGGAEICSFKNTTRDPRYRGYEYGSHDYLIYRDGECIHVADLLFHQIAEHHFFQDVDYRVEPATLARVLDLHPDLRIDIVETIRYERSGSCPVDLQETKPLMTTVHFHIDRVDANHILAKHRVDDAVVKEDVVIDGVPAVLQGEGIYRKRAVREFGPTSTVQLVAQHRESVCVIC